MADSNIFFFETADDLREWFTKNYQSYDSIWIGYFKIKSGKPSVSWPESIEQALCFGWIDGLLHSIDESSYKVRFTPRKTNSQWSEVNIKSVKRLRQAGLMHKAGLNAFKLRREDKSLRSSYGQDSVTLDKNYEDKIDKSFLF